MAEPRMSELVDGAVRGVRRIRVRRWALAISAGVAVGGCAAGAVVLLESPTSPLAPTKASAVPRAAGAAVRVASTDAAIYEAALREGPVPGLDAGSVYVESVRCRGSEPGLEPCDLQPIPPSVETEVRSALPKVRFVTREQTADLHGGTLVRFGPITYSDGAATRAYLPIDVHCGPMCGEGTTLVLAQRADATGWHVVGRTGVSWIS